MLMWEPEECLIKDAKEDRKKMLNQLPKKFEFALKSERQKTHPSNNTTDEESSLLSEERPLFRESKMKKKLREIVLNKKYKTQMCKNYLLTG